MDVLSDVIRTMRRGVPKFTRTFRHGSWGNTYGPYDGAGFHIVLLGSCWLISVDGPPVLLSVGDVVFFPHGGQHGISDNADVRLSGLPTAPQVELDPGWSEEEDQYDRVFLLCGAYRLEQGRAHPMLASLPEMLHLPARLGHDPGLRSIVDLLATNLQRSEPGADAALPALLDLLLVYIMRTWFAHKREHEPGADWHMALTDPTIATALQSIHRQPAEPWTVDTLAGTAGLSRTVFARRFVELVGQPPISYLNWWRLNTSTLLLQQSDATIGAVARKVGYASEFSYSNAFKREFGVAPGRFRKRRPPHDL